MEAILALSQKLISTGFHFWWYSSHHQGKINAATGLASLQTPGSSNIAPVKIRLAITIKIHIMD